MGWVYVRVVESTFEAEGGISFPRKKKGRKYRGGWNGVRACTRSNKRDGLRVRLLVSRNVSLRFSLFSWFVWGEKQGRGRYTFQDFGLGGGGFAGALEGTAVGEVEDYAFFLGAVSFCVLSLILGGGG